MKETFEVEVKEILARKVSVEIEMNGQSEESAQAQAIEKAQRMYDNEEIVLDSSNHIETIIKQKRIENIANISFDTLNKITEFINENNVSIEDKKVIADILDIKVCSVCKNLMYLGYQIVDDCACTDECKAELVSDDESDGEYYREWM